jgi:chromosome partitioning protein
MPNAVTHLDPNDKAAVQSEHRMARHLLNYYRTLRADHRFPLITQLDLDKIRDYVPNAFTLQLDAGPEGSTLRFIGGELGRDCGGDFTNRTLSDLPPHSLLAIVTGNLHQVLESQGPLILSDGICGAEGAETLYRAVMLPFSTTGDKIDYIIGAANRSHGHIIVLGSGKGGTGKSTTAMHLIASLLYRGDKVGSIDLDSFQRTLSRYLENRERLNAHQGLDLPVPDHVSASDWDTRTKSFEMHLARLARSCDYVVIDTPGSDTDLSRAAHRRADTVITPINDSFLDLDVLAVVDDESGKILRLGPYAEIAVEAREHRAARHHRPPKWIVLRNRLSNLPARNKQRMADTLEHLSGELDFQNGLGLTDRVIYRELFPLGLTLLDLHKKPAGITFSMSHVAARQELRALMEQIEPPRTDRATPSEAHLDANALMEPSQWHRHLPRLVLGADDEV